MILSSAFLHKNQASKFKHANGWTLTFSIMCKVELWHLVSCARLNFDIKNHVQSWPVTLTKLNNIWLHIDLGATQICFLCRYLCRYQTFKWSCWTVNTADSPPAGNYEEYDPHYWYSSIWKHFTISSAFNGRLYLYLHSLTQFHMHNAPIHMHNAPIHIL